MADLEKMGARDERTRETRKMGRLSAEQAEAIKAKIAKGEAGQYEAAILWQELERLGSAGQGEPKSRFDLTVKLWNEYRKNRILPAFDTLALDYQLFAQYVVGHFTTAPAEKEA